MYSDSHAHLVDYEPEHLKKVLEQMRFNQIGFALSVGVNLDSSEGTIHLARSHSQVKAAVGIHPWFAQEPDSTTRRRFHELAGSEYVVALGEIGLDYAPPMAGGNSLPKEMPNIEFPKDMPPLPEEPASKEVQRELLRFELSVAVAKQLPVNVHCHEAHEDMMQMLREPVNAGLTGIAHGFIGTVAELDEWLDLGFYISLGNMGVTFEELPSLETIVRTIPIDRLVVETDANPVLSPNGPVDVIPVVRKIASILGDTPENIGNKTTQNLERLLKL